MCVFGFHGSALRIEGGSPVPNRCSSILDLGTFLGLFRYGLVIAPSDVCDPEIELSKNIKKLLFPLPCFLVGYRLRPCLTACPYWYRSLQTPSNLHAARGGLFHVSKTDFCSRETSVSDFRIWLPDQRDSRPFPARQAKNLCPNSVHCPQGGNVQKGGKSVGRLVPIGVADRW